MVLAILISLEKAFSFFNSGGRQIPDGRNTGVYPLIKQTIINRTGNFLEPVQPDDRAITGGFYQFNSLIFIKFIINSLNFFQSTAGVFVSEHNNPLHIAQLFSGRGFKGNFKGDGIIMGYRFGILKHRGDHIAGHPIIYLHQKFLGVGQAFNFRAQIRKETVNFPRHSLLKIFDYGPGIQATMMLLHLGICPRSPGGFLFKTHDRELRGNVKKKHFRCPYYRVTTKNLAAINNNSSDFSCKKPVALSFFLDLPGLYFPH